MPFVSQKPALILAPEVCGQLLSLSRSRTESKSRVERARMLLLFAQGAGISAIARDLATNRPRVERTINKALELGALAALADLPGRGRPALIGPEERAWVLSLACQKPAQLGYAQELWTTSLLAAHVRAHALAMGFPALVRFSRGTVSKLLSRAGVRPHTITYYLERRDPEFEAKMAQVLCVYREMQLLSAQGESAESGFCASLSYDEKPGIQALGSTAPDLPPQPGEYPSWARDYEYVRHGTLSLLAGIDLATGRILATVRERHRSREFVEFLELVDAGYPKKTQIRVILDNHSAHTSRETRGYLALHPNRFLFVFTPKHASWLNLIESFFAKMTRGFLRGIRVKSKEELTERILRYLEQLNQDPVIFRWTYKLDEVSVA